MMVRLFIVALIIGIGTLQVFPSASLEVTIGKKIWEVVMGIQYPWRLLGIMTIVLLSSLLLAVAILKQNNSTLYRIISCSLIIAGLVFNGMYYFNFINESETFKRLSIPNTSLIAVWGGEYLPLGVSTDVYLPSGVSVSSNEVEVFQYDKDEMITRVILKNYNDQEENVIFPVFNYNNYRIIQEETGEEYPVESGENMCIQTIIPPYFEGTLLLQYVAPFYWRIAEWVSIISFIGVGIYVIIQKKKGVYT